MSLLIYGLRGGYTHAHTHTHTHNRSHESDFKKPGTRQPAAALKT